MEIPGYQIEQLIAEGGMSSVYLAVQESLGRRVAIKVLRKFGNPEQAERFLHEARIIASLEHRNIITIYDVGAIGERYYIAMEYLEGGCLADRIDHGLQPLAALGLLEKMARCLDFVHRRDIVHRDIKPSNILFHADGTPKLTDFGIAKQLDEDQEATLEGTAFGSPYYLSPEQAEGRPLDGRSDIYSLGIVFFQMLTGRKPYSESSHIETIVAHLSNPIPVLPEAFSEFQGLLESMIAKSPQNRIASARELAHRIRDLRSSQAERRKADRRSGRNAAQADMDNGPVLGLIDHVRGASVVAKSLAIAGLLIFVLGLDWLLETPKPTPVVELQRAPRVQLSYTGRNGVPSKVVAATPMRQEEPVEESEEEASANLLDTEDAMRSDVAPESVGLPITEPVEDVDVFAESIVVEQPQPEVEKEAFVATEPLVLAETETETEIEIEIEIEMERETGTETETHVAAEAGVTDQKDELIVDRMRAGDKALLADRLTTPAADNAYAHYKAVLELDADHRGARAGIGRIADRYAALARWAKGEQKYRLARIYVRRGFAVRRGHAGLLAVRSDLDRVEALASAQASANPAPVAEKPKISSWEFEGTSVTSTGPEGTGNIVKDFKNVWRSVFD